MSETKESKSKATSAALLALGLFLLGNFVLLAFNPLAKVDPESMPSAHTWTWWASKEYLAQKPSPDVVILGSSLLMHPISLAEANFLGKDIDYVNHHKSTYLSAQLSKKLGVEQTAFNFALPGSMVSDDYMVIRALFKQEHKPKLVIIGLGVRDFIDSGVTCPVATPPFRYLKRFDNIDDVAHLCMPEIWHRIEYYLGKAIYPVGKKLDMQVVLAESCKKTLLPLWSRILPPCRLAEVDPTKNLPGNLRSEIEEGVFMVKANAPYSFTDNSSEYRKRFRNKNEKMFGIQVEFLDRLLALAKERNIEIMLVNVPVTQANLSLVPQGGYERYLEAVSRLSQKWQTPFVDLARTNTFEDSKDYYDTAHMNARGGRKLLNAFAEAVCNQQLLQKSRIAKEHRNLAL